MFGLQQRYTNHQTPVVVNWRNKTFFHLTALLI